MLSGKPIGASGSVVACSMEGTRPILLEIQALICQTNFGNPRRTATGTDYNRVNLLMAVIEKRIGIQMSDYDAYVFVTPVYFWEMSESAKTFFDRLKRCDAFNDESNIKKKKIVCIACAGGSGNGTEDCLKSFDILNHFLGTEMYGRIPVTKFNFEEQKEVMKEKMEFK